MKLAVLTMFGLCRLQSDQNNIKEDFRLISGSTDLKPSNKRVAQTNSLCYVNKVRSTDY